MRILYIHQYFNTHQEAGGSRSYSLAKALVDHGHSVIMLTSNRQNCQFPFKTESDIDGIKVIYIKNRYSNNMGFLRRIWSFIQFTFISLIVVVRLRHIDLVFATSTPLTVGIPGMIYKRIYRLPFVFEVRDLWPDLAIAMGILKNSAVISLSRWLERKTYQESNHIISLAPGITDSIIRRGIQPQRITMIPNGCDIELFTHNFGTSPADWPFEPDDFILLYAGTHGLANGLQWVIDLAIETKYRQKDKIKFVLIGNGMTKAGLIRQKEEHRLNNVIFLDPIPKCELVKYFAAADMGMQLLANIPDFYYGTSPNKFFDYLAAGIPVLNNYPGWIAELIRKWHCGIVVKPDDFDDFFNQIKLVIDNRELLKVMGARAQELAISMFHRDQLSSNFVEVLETVFSNHIAKVA